MNVAPRSRPESVAPPTPVQLPAEPADAQMSAPGLVQQLALCLPVEVGDADRVLGVLALAAVEVGAVRRPRPRAGRPEQRTGQAPGRAGPALADGDGLMSTFA